MADAIGRLWSALLRLVLLVFGLALFLGVMVFGAVVAVCLAAWALLTGRRIAPVDFGWKRRFERRGGAGGAAPRPPPADDVVDIEVREIEPPLQPDRELRKPPR